MSYSDDQLSTNKPFYGDESGDIFALLDEKRSKTEMYTHSFETQSGFLVIVKPSEDSYSMSFRRQIGTPPNSSITLTVDEAKRLSNLLGPRFDAEAVEGYTADDAAEYTSFARHAPKYGKANKGGGLAIIVGTATLCLIIAIFTYQMKVHTGQ